VGVANNVPGNSGTAFSLLLDTTEQLKREYEAEISALKDQLSSLIKQQVEKRAAHAAERALLLGEMNSLRLEMERTSGLIEKLTAQGVGKA